MPSKSKRKSAPKRNQKSVNDSQTRRLVGRAVFWAAVFSVLFAPIQFHTEAVEAATGGAGFFEGIRAAALTGPFYFLAVIVSAEAAIRLMTNPFLKASESRLLRWLGINDIQGLSLLMVVVTLFIALTVVYRIPIASRGDEFLVWQFWVAPIAVAWNLMIHWIVSAAEAKRRAE